MPKQVMPKQVTPKQPDRYELQLKWEDFWTRIWGTLFHTLGIITVIAVFLLGAGWLLYTIFSTSPAPTITTAPAKKLGYSEKGPLQAAFNVLLANEKRPCASKNKSDKVSYVRDCTLFLIRLGLTDFQASQILDKSGFFRDKSHHRTDACKPDDKDCYSQLTVSNATELGVGVDISISFNFTEDMPNTYVATKIRLLFHPGSFPYFDPDIMRATFVKLIGPPDQSTSTDDRWGSFGGANIHAYIYRDRSYWVILQDRSRIIKEPKKEEPKKDEQKKEGK